MDRNEIVTELNLQQRDVAYYNTQQTLVNGWFDVAIKAGKLVIDTVQATLYSD